MSKTILSELDGFTPVIDCLVQEYGLVTAAVFGRIWRFCQMKDGVCNAPLEKVSEGIGLDKATIMRHAKKLVEGGYLVDLTPDLKNHPHTYADTGKVTISSQISVAHRNAEKASVAQCNAGVAECNTGVAESQLKIVDKIDSKKEVKGEKIKIPEGLPPRTGDVVGDWLKMSASLSEKNKASAAVMERLSVLNRNWPHYGDGKHEDFWRVCRLIASAEAEGRGTVEQFVDWVNGQKDHIGMVQWYGRKPDNIWQDWGLCFGTGEIPAKPREPGTGFYG
jgi:hypothetical protein